MNISTLNNEQKKRLLSDLIKNDEDVKKRQKYKFKYPEFKQTIDSYNFIIQELHSNINKNNKIIENLELEISNLDSCSSLNETIKNIKTHNIKIANNIKHVETLIIKLKFNFQDLCIHEWITNYEYKLKNSTKLTNKLYCECDESDLKNIKSQNEEFLDVNISNWEKKLVHTNFEEYDCYDREIYIKCKTFNCKHTINFYSK